MSSLPLANQVRQVYVVAADGLVSVTPASEGQLKVLGEAGKLLYFQHFGKGGLTASDKIDVENIRYVKHTTASEMVDKLGVHTVKVTTVSAGQVYEVKVLVHNYIGQGAYDYTYRFGLYKAKASDTVNTIAAGLKADLELNLKGEPLFDVSVSDDTITITEKNVPSAVVWDKAKFPVAYMPIEITLNGIVTDDEIETFDWATIGKSTTSANNVGKKMAELEYFAMGNRGDVYRQMGYPRNIDTEYLVDPTSNSYDVIDIHYFYQGQGVSSQKSEKEITLITASSEASDILDAIAEVVGTNKIVAPELYPKSSN